MNYNQQQIRNYTKQCCRNIQSILSDLGIDHIVQGDNVKLKCPVHGSSKVGNSTISLSRQVWSCWSNMCHEVYPMHARVLGLVKSTLEQQGLPSQWRDIFKFVDEHSDSPINIEFTEGFEELKPMEKKFIPDAKVPSGYFMSRGARQSTLEHFKVGDVFSGYYRNRAIIPVYNDQFLVGITARSHWPECSKCGYHHPVDFDYCPEEESQWFYSKWLNSKGFQKSKILYNLCSVGSVKKIALVEGPSCVWKLHEFGIPAIACLGGSFNAVHKHQLSNKGIKDILLLFDSDGAGKEFTTNFLKKYHSDFGIHLVNLPKKDVFDMDTREIAQHIQPKWEFIR